MRTLKVIIVEDEPGAASNLQSILNDVTPHAKVMAVIPSIEETVKWLVNQPAPDLGFFDIQLEDGLSFDIFKKAEIKFPVIFTTAFDQYAIDAFKVNSIDYLLKPIREKDLAFSIRKYEQLNRSNLDKELLERVIKSVSIRQTTSFLVHYKDKLIPVLAADIAYFYIGGGLVHACTVKNQSYPMEHTLDELEMILDEALFFRANRQYIINRSSIRDIELYFNGRLAVNLHPQPAEWVLVSKARVPVFKAWMRGRE